VPTYTIYVDNVRMFTDGRCQISGVEDDSTRHDNVEIPGALADTAWLHQMSNRGKLRIEEDDVTGDIEWVEFSPLY
jgi:hypothetical protein